MADFDLIVRNGLAVLDEGVIPADIGIADGQIVGVAEELAGAGAEEIDAEGLHVFPGGVDPHVHFDEPGREHWEGFATGTRALAAGGVTTYVDMPLNCTPVTVDGESFDAKLGAAEASSLVDFAFWGGLIPGNLDKLEELADRGVAGFKAFMCHAGIEEFPAADDFTLYEGMQLAAELGRLVAVHAENDVITRALAEKARREGRVGPRDFIATRPPIVEVEAIARAILLAEETGCALHIVHVSTARGVLLVNEAQARGADVTCETCPHFLLFTEEDIDELGADGKCLPPLRADAERRGLWGLLEAGAIPIVASDHSPSPPEMKGGDDFFEVWGGISGCQSTLGLLVAAAHTERGFALDIIAKLVGTNAARRLGLSNKGQLTVGRDADLALVDLSHEETLEAQSLLYRHRASAFVGQRTRGRVVRTLVRGTTVFDNGRVVCEPVGRLVVPAKLEARWSKGGGHPRLATGASRHAVSARRKGVTHG